jgi:hypothetical protein
MMKRAIALMLVLGALAFAGCVSNAGMRKDYYKDNPAVVANRASMGIFCYTNANGIFNAMQRLFVQRGIKLTRDRGADILWTNTIHQSALGDFTVIATLSEVVSDADSCIKMDWKLVGKSGSLDEQASKAYVDGLNQDLLKSLKELAEVK